jgi:hypothetical protein
MAALQRPSHVPVAHDDGEARTSRRGLLFLRDRQSAGIHPLLRREPRGERWLIKRLVVDGWDEERATAEASALGQRSDALRQFAIEYAKTHRR